MAVEAGAQQHHARRRTATDDQFAAERLTVVHGRIVTRLAEIGLTLNQHRRLHRSMRCVTEGALLLDGRVFPKERPAFFVMTVETGIVDGFRDQQVRPNRPVRVVTVGAGHDPLHHRMVGRLEFCARCSAWHPKQTAD